MRELGWLGAESVDYVLPFVFYFLCRRAGARLYLLMALSGVALQLAKLAFHTARPCWIDPRIQDLAGWGGYGLPSGHVFMAAALWFGIAKAIGSRWAWSAAGTIVFLTAISRLYLGVHSVCDVVAGAGLGLGLSAGLEILEKRLSAVLTSWQVWHWLAATCWLAVFLWLLGQLLQFLLQAISDPAAWTVYSVQARSLDGLHGAIRNFLGVGCILVIARRWASFDLPKALWLRGLVFVYAMAVAWCLREGCLWLPRPENESARLALDWIEINAVSVWMLLVLPWLLLKTRVFNTSTMPKRETTRRKPNSASCEEPKQFKNDSRWHGIYSSK
jgi:hypothetical protein